MSADAEVRSLAAQVLCAQGYIVHEAVTAAQAVRQVQGGSPVTIKLLVADLALLQGEGQHLAERLLARDPDVRVVLLADADQIHELPRLVRQGQGALLFKPVVPAVFAQTVRALVDA